MVEDLQVVKRVVDGDVEAFEILLRRHSECVFRTVGRRVPTHDVESVAQEAFVSAFRSLKSFRGKQPFEHWLLRIARRRCCDYWRSRQRRPELIGGSLREDQREWLEHVSAGLRLDSFHHECEREEAAEVVHNALSRLDAEDRALIESIYFEGLQLKEVAATFGWSLAKVKVRAYRARRKLRDVIEKFMAKEQV